MSAAIAYVEAVFRDPVTAPIAIIALAFAAAAIIANHCAKRW